MSDYCDDWQDDCLYDAFDWFDPPANTGGNKHGPLNWFWWAVIFALLIFFLWRASL